MQYKYAIQICNTDMQYGYAVQICNTDMQHTYVIHISYIQYRHAITICNKDMQYDMLYDNPSSGAGGDRHTIVSDIFPYRTAERAYPTCTRTTKLKVAVGALCWDNSD